MSFLYFQILKKKKTIGKLVARTVKFYLYWFQLLKFWYLTAWYSSTVYISIQKLHKLQY